MSNVGHQSVGFFTVLYWIGIFMTLACLALILASNTDLGYAFEHIRIPLSWMLAGIALFAFVAAELCHPAVTEAADEEEEGILLPSPECEPIEA
jgi:hypothetical protein